MQRQLLYCHCARRCRHHTGLGSTPYWARVVGSGDGVGSFQCRGVLLLWHMVGQGPAVLTADAGRVGYIYIFFISSVLYLPLLMSYSWETAVLTEIFGGARWLSGRVSDSGARGRWFETYRRRVVSLSKTLYSPKILVNYPGSGGSVPT